MAENIRLSMKFSSLYRKTNYLTPLESIVNSVYEYDMKSAGFSVIKEYGLISKTKIDKIDLLDKKERNETIGKLKIKNKELVKNEKKGILTARECFFRANGIKDEDVVSIKNDAIFIAGRKARVTEFGKYIEFSLKNSYTSYHNINGIEFYYNKREDILHIKNLSKNIDQAHYCGICKFLKTVFKYIEYDRFEELKKYLIDFSILYKSKKLGKEYYKEFNHDSMYRYKESAGDYFLLLDDIDDSFISDLNISYNYMFIILPLLQKYLY